ncbi:hypothetical protein [Enterovibrio norvegicus]|uniref:hypothetical protein n=1 Tax=Enterovibrio norvegicus TaxID=188144 RepID=UPI0024B24E79|nr:hypothetical protein [Enterovibrio norvegicus]
MQEHIIKALWIRYPNSIQIGFDGANYFLEPSQQIDWDAVNAKAQLLEQEKIAWDERFSMRQDIYRSAGDVDSILGTTADAVQLLLVEMSKLTLALNQATTIEQIQSAALPFSACATRILSKIESGDVKMPYMTKDFDDVLTDIETRATAVTGVLNDQ